MPTDHEPNLAPAAPAADQNLYLQPIRKNRILAPNGVVPVFILCAIACAAIFPFLAATNNTASPDHIELSSSDGAAIKHAVSFYCVIRAPIHPYPTKVRLRRRAPLDGHHAPLPRR